MNPENPDSALLPRDPKTGEPLPSTKQPGYYPGFSIMSQKAYWDQATRNVITMRVEQPPAIRHFTSEQARFSGDFIHLSRASFSLIFLSLSPAIVILSAAACPERSRMGRIPAFLLVD